MYYLVTIVLAVTGLLVSIRCNATGFNRLPSREILYGGWDLEAVSGVMDNFLPKLICISNTSKKKERFPFQGVEVAPFIQVSSALVDNQFLSREHCQSSSFCDEFLLFYSRPRICANQGTIDHKLVREKAGRLHRILNEILLSRKTSLPLVIEKIRNNVEIKVQGGRTSIISNLVRHVHMNFCAVVGSWFNGKVRYRRCTDNSNPGTIAYGQSVAGNARTLRSCICSYYPKLDLLISIYSSAAKIAHRNIVAGYQFLPLLVGDTRVDNYCDEGERLKCAYENRPSPFWFGLLGFVLYGYGYISAKVGHGNWFSLVAFFVGLPMCAYGIFQILDTIGEMSHALP